MFEGFTPRRVLCGDVEIHAVVGGQGPALLLLHGHPQTHVIWHKVAAALARHFTGGVTQPHRDDLLAVDDCLAIDGAAGWRVGLTRTNAVSQHKPSNRYEPIPKAVVAAWAARRAGR